MIRHFLLTLVVLALSVGIFTLTLLRLSPVGGQAPLAFFSFFLSLFFGVTAFFTLVSFFAAEMVVHHRLGTRAYLIALRRGSLVGIYVCGLGVLQLFHMLSLFEAVVLAIFLALVEMIFVSAGK